MRQPNRIVRRLIFQQGRANAKRRVQGDRIDALDARVNDLDAKTDLLDAEIDANEVRIDDHEGRITILEMS